jgi:hypothetical protein
MLSGFLSQFLRNATAQKKIETGGTIDHYETQRHGKALIAGKELALAAPVKKYGMRWKRPIGH